MWESFSLSRASSIRWSTRSSYEWVRLFPSEVARQSSHVRWGDLTHEPQVELSGPIGAHVHPWKQLLLVAHVFRDSRSGGKLREHSSSSICVRTLRSVS